MGAADCGVGPLRDRCRSRPDGRKIAFASNRDGRLEAYVMNADGSGQRRLAGRAKNAYPSSSRETEQPEGPACGDDA